MTTLDRPLRSEADFISASATVFCCPRCAGTLERREDAVACTQCGRSYPMTDDLPRMFVPNEWWFKEASMAFWPSQIKEGGFFIVIARAPRAN